MSIAEITPTTADEIADAFLEYLDDERVSAFVVGRDDEPADEPAAATPGTYGPPETGPAMFTAADFLAAWSAVALAVSKDASRPVMQCIRLECADDGYTVELVATDSYRLHRATISAREPMPMEWRGRAVNLQPVNLTALKQLLRREVIIRLELGEDRQLSSPRRTYTVGTFTGAITGEVYDHADYPAWRNILEHQVGRPGETTAPEARDIGVMFAVNPRYLSDIGKASALFAVDDVTPLRCVSAPSPMRPVMWRTVAQDRGELDCLIMPVRIS